MKIKLEHRRNGKVVSSCKSESLGSKEHLGQALAEVDFRSLPLSDGDKVTVTILDIEEYHSCYLCEDGLEGNDRKERKPHESA